jgi:hypothetical protein
MIVHPPILCRMESRKRFLSAREAYAHWRLINKFAHGQGLPQKDLVKYYLND